MVICRLPIALILATIEPRPPYPIWETQHLSALHVDFPLSLIVERRTLTVSSSSSSSIFDWRMAKYGKDFDLVLNAYNRLDRDQLVFFLSVRSLSTTGSDEELAFRIAQHDLQTFKFPCNQKTDVLLPRLAGPVGSSGCSKASNRVRQTSRLPELPTELLAEILDQLGDWELSKAVGLPTSLSRPIEWTRASATDEAMLTGYLPLIRSADLALKPPTKLGATLTVRFGYVHVLDMLIHSHRSIFLSLFDNDLIPICASHSGRTSVLNWWKHAIDAHSLPSPSPSAIASSIDGASRNGEIASLDWWLASGFPLEYTDAALESASAKNRIDVLEWWRTSGLPLKIGRVMEAASNAGHVEVLDWWAQSQLEFKYDRQALHHASLHGRVNVLQWWLDSGLQLFFDHDALLLASRYNRPDVLEWWYRSGLPAQYRMCDIEEALEDAIGGGEAAREWWKRKGIDFNANDAEWMKLRTLH